MESNCDIQILDCTLRDGGYLNNWHFDKRMAREIYRALSKSGVDFIEIGFRGNEAQFSRDTYGLWRFTEDELVHEIISGIDGPKIAVMGDFGKIHPDDFARAEESPVDMVRLAAHKNNIRPCIELAEKIKGKGYEVSLQAMGYTNYTQDERESLAEMVEASAMDYLYVADSYGSIFPDQIESLFAPLKKISHVKLGFHPHNNLQMAFANTLEAIKCGVHIVDGTLNGIGRGAGNLPIEVLLLYMEMTKGEKYNVVPVLNCIDTYLLPLQKELGWGYQLPYMLSGMYKCHANYALNLIKLRQYNIEDICVAMERINRINPVGYSQDVLDRIIAEGIIGRPDSISHEKPVDMPEFYINRHQGRDFLVLANGPNLSRYKDKIDEFIKKYDPIILGANNLSGLFIPHYHVFNNKRRFAMYVDSVSAESTLLLSRFFAEDMIKEYTDRPYERLYYCDRLDAEFDIVDGIIQSNCRTVSVLLLGLAIAMGAKRVFAAGLDGYLSDGSKQLHYYDEAVSQTDEDMLVELHHMCQKFIAQIDQYLVDNGKQGVNIITPTSYRKFYKGIDNYV